MYNTKVTDHNTESNMKLQLSSKLHGATYSATVIEQTKDKRT